MRIGGRASVRQAMARGDGVEPAAAEKMRREVEPCENIGKGPVAHIEAAGIGAESRHYQPSAVTDKAAAADELVKEAMG